MKNLKKPKKTYADIIVIDEYNEEMIESIFENQKSAKMEDRKKVLLILDDLADELNSQNQTLKKVFFKGRHFKISCWISTQSYKAIPRGIRINAPSYILLNLNPNETKLIAEELAKEEKNIFLEKLSRCLDVKYSFMYLNMKTELSKMYCDSFKHFIN